jgi:hypothetical protein
MLDPEFLQAEPQRIGVQAQDARGATRPLDDAVRLGQDALNVLPLHLLQARGWELAVGVGDNRGSRASSISTRGPRARIVARSSTFCNSRTLPGQA